MYHYMPNICICQYFFLHIFRFLKNTCNSAPPHGLSFRLLPCGTKDTSSAGERKGRLCEIYRKRALFHYVYGFERICSKSTIWTRHAYDSQITLRGIYIVKNSGTVLTIRTDSAAKISCFAVFIMVPRNYSAAKNASTDAGTSTIFPRVSTAGCFSATANNAGDHSL